MGVLLFLIFVIGFSLVAEEFVKKMREETIGQEKIFANYILIKEKNKTGSWH